MNVTVMRRTNGLILAISSLILLGQFYAYYNITYTNTTLTLNRNGSTHVIESLNLFVSNSSVQQYTQSRNSIGLTLSYWQSLLYNSNLTEHIVNSKHSVYGFAFLPGPLIKVYNGGAALLTLNYYVNNVTSIQNIAPRRFEYTFNSSVFNFEHTANGQALPGNTRLNMVIPSRATVVSVYPLPDAPPPSFINSYANVTEFSWYTQEPLSQFSFSFVVQQSLQDEVLGYFSGVYNSYRVGLYIVALAIIAFIILYIYVRSGGVSGMAARRS